jgi:hypothetical protein
MCMFDDFTCVSKCIEQMMLNEVCLWKQRICGFCENGMMLHVGDGMEI